MEKWQEITSLEAWSQALEQSNHSPLLLFKHSTTCPISSEALTQLQNYLDQQHGGRFPVVLVKVIESRPVSNQIAEDTHIKHESPQAILIHQQKVVWSASHWSITSKSLEQATSQLQ